MIMVCGKCGKETAVGEQIVTESGPQVYCVGCYRESLDPKPNEEKNMASFETAKADAQQVANELGVTLYVTQDHNGSWRHSVKKPVDCQHSSVEVVEPQRPPLALCQQIAYARLDLIQGRELASLHRSFGHPEQAIEAVEESVRLALALLQGESDEQREAKS